MSNTTSLAVTRAESPAFLQLASVIGVSVNDMVDAIKGQCFRGSAKDVSDAQLVTFISIAKEMGVNPLLPGFLYAYPNNGGITPIMGPDGIYHKLSSSESVDHWESTVYPEDITKEPTHAIAEIWHHKKERPIRYIASFKEWRVQSNPNWQNRPRHMLGLRALKQCARQIIHGLPGDEDDRTISEINVTTPGSATTAPDRPEAPAPEAKGLAAVRENKRRAAPAPVIDAEVTATSVAPEIKPAPVEAPKPEPKVDAKPEPVKEAPKAAAPAEDLELMDAPVKVQAKEPVKPRTSLNEDEVVTFDGLEVVEFTAKPNAQQVLIVVVEVKGPFTGKILQGGGAKTVDGQTVYNFPWKVGSKVKATIKGKKTASGNVICSIQTVEEV